ncbi:GATA-domain-containing protein [Rozella allomycis CSF55]|uniref:GATA-domain-containing protein n=1 Tax=Rozella allomycis (strain CSF55) TaxID=988480 RepID=A0A075B0X8_ROZAC|nr:Zinc finger, GATA-type domain-containing protein [Rozella allomycis CSF55]RKP18754.1 GATA-domain-containing protein [Rozella allomycis CSF55]|eukprot:EPZ34586.1 Zinc finger, GATA-type domain-containing protein [Rozella allomycis CSF55]
MSNNWDNPSDRRRRPSLTGNSSDPFLSMPWTPQELITEEMDLREELFPVSYSKDMSLFSTTEQYFEDNEELLTANLSTPKCSPAESQNHLDVNFLTPQPSHMHNNYNFQMQNYSFPQLHYVPPTQRFSPIQAPYNQHQLLSYSSSRRFSMPDASFFNWNESRVQKKPHISQDNFGTSLGLRISCDQTAGPVDLKTRRRSKITSRICVNCKTSSTPMWRRSAENEVLCNACGIYNASHGGQNRPLKLAERRNSLIAVRDQGKCTKRHDDAETIAKTK